MVSERHTGSLSGGEGEGQPKRRPHEAGLAVSGSEDAERDHKPKSAGSLRKLEKAEKEIFPYIPERNADTVILAGETHLHL